MKGSALIAAFILVFVGALIVGGFLLYISGESQLTKKSIDSVKAFYIAEAGLERALWATEEDWPDGDPDNQIFTLNGIAQTSYSGGTYTVTETWITPNLKKRIKSVGTFGDEIRTVNTDVYLDPDVNFYNQVVASCSGGGGANKIKGHVKIMGSVYILGEEPFVDANADSLYTAGESFIDINGDSAWGQYLDVTDADPDNDYAFRMGGNSEIGNNYSVMPSALQSRVPTIYDGDFEWNTLNADLKVKYGKVSLESNSATIGAPNDDEDGDKNFMDRVIVPDGIDVSEGNIYTDELLTGVSYRSMFNDEVRMPSMKDAYTDVATGTFYPSPADPYNTDTLGGYEQFLYDVANDVGDPDRGVFINGDLVITPTSSFTYGDIYDTGKSGISMDGNGNLSINGLIYVNGSLTFDTAPGQDDILYSGRGSFYVRGYRDADATNDVVVNLNLLTEDVYYGAFPNNALGVMTRENILFSGAQNDVAGVFYAEKSVTMTKQYEIAGTVIATNFDMTDQVPEIYQVPELGDNQPPYMLTALFPGQGPVVEQWYETYDD